MNNFSEGNDNAEYTLYFSKSDISYNALCSGSSNPINSFLSLSLKNPVDTGAVGNTPSIAPITNTAFGFSDIRFPAIPIVT